MAFAPIRRTRLSQSMGEGIDWHDPLSTKLRSSVSLRALYDSAINKGLAGPHTGTKVVGMGRGFGAAVGAGTTDKILMTTSGNSGPRSYFVVANANGWGGGNLGRFIEGTTATQEVFYINNAVGLVYFRQFGSGARTANINNASIVSALFGKVATFSVSFDSSNPANQAELYVNGVRYPFSTADGTPTGTASTTGVHYIGNRASDNARCFDGTIYSVDVFDRMLSALEHSQLSALAYRKYL